MAFVLGKRSSDDIGNTLADAFAVDWPKPIVDNKAPPPSYLSLQTCHKQIQRLAFAYFEEEYKKHTLNWSHQLHDWSIGLADIDSELDSLSIYHISILNRLRSNHIGCADYFNWKLTPSLNKPIPPLKCPHCSPQYIIPVNSGFHPLIDCVHVLFYCQHMRISIK